MSICYVIATAKIVPRENWEAFCKVVKKMVPGIKGMIFADGYGCANLGICLAKDNETAIKELALALMPSRYAVSSDEPWEGDIFKMNI